MIQRKPRLENKVALITGASRGLGKAMAIRFAEEGASIGVNYIHNRESAEEVCQNIVNAGGRAITVQADVADPSQVTRMAQTVLREFKKIDILINNAGVLKLSLLMEASLADITRMIDVNIKGMIHCVQAVGADMMARKYGRIVNLSSLAAMGTAHMGTSGYAATKAAVVALTKRLAFELGAYNITVNAIAPGTTKTDMVLGKGRRPEILPKLEEVARRAMLGRVGEPEDVANAALFLASDEASFITSQTLTVDGGRTDFLSHSA